MVVSKFINTLFKVICLLILRSLSYKMGVPDFNIKFAYINDSVRLLHLNTQHVYTF